MAWPVTMFRLVSEPTEAGLCCDKNGLTLAGIPLLVSEDSGFEPRPTDELQGIFDAAYGADAGIDAESRFPGLRSVARALGAGDLSRAMIASLLLKLPDIDADGVARLASARMLKANYNPTEARGWHERWTAGNSGGAKDPNIVPVQFAPAAPIPAPGFPGIVKPNRPDDDYTFPPSNETGEPANDNSPSLKPASPLTQNQPSLCPPETPESTAGRTLEQLLYQQQITGLPIGFDVQLNGIRYDGCREDNGNMQEAKLLSDWLLRIPAFFIRMMKGYQNIMDQAMRQSLNADGRLVEWHFSSPGMRLFFDAEFKRAGFRNILTYYTPYLGPTNN
jgi:hypothetical protein